MATVIKENVGMLHDKLTLTLDKEDYLPAFEKTLKDYSKKANIPGFRKGMVPAGLIKKMYGNSLFTDEVLRSIDRELVKYLETEKINIFAQPLPDEINLRQLDVNSPSDYHFSFEIGLKPEFELPNLPSLHTIRYKVQVTDEMINNEIARLQNRYGNMKDEETVSTEENVLNVMLTEADENGNEVPEGIKKDNSLLVKYFAEGIRNDLMGKSKNDFIIIKLKTGFDDKEREWIMGDLGLNKDDQNDADKNFKIHITKVGLLEKRELNEDFFNQLYPNRDVKSEADFRNKINDEIQAYWDGQAKSQLQHQAYHELLDQTEIKFPEGFLKKWMKTQGENPRTDEDIEKEFPMFINQLKWTLISDKIVAENSMQITSDEIRSFAKQQLFGYMGMGVMDEEQPWIKDYLEKMMKDRKYVEDAYNRLQSQKILDWVETQLQPEQKEISSEDFTKMVEAHQHH
ncbi:MAG TPA: trigger factor [Chitinophagaceae bacterium]|nr:trigger factor [Chitinophagaceae bacterium]